MEEQNQPIMLGEIPVLSKKLKCPFCTKMFKSVKGQRNHVKKFHHNSVNTININTNREINDVNTNDMFDNDDTVTEIIDYDYDFREASPLAQDNELARLKKELENIILNNPSISLDEPVNTLMLEKINHMSIEEIKARIFHAKRALNSKLDYKISDGALGIVNQVVGRLLGCVDELEQAVMNDELLRQSTKDLLSINLLAKIPSQIKVAGLYSVNVGYALNQAKNKNIKLENTNIAQEANV